jgi:hypothetical protein
LIQDMLQIKSLGLENIKPLSKANFIFNS